MSNTSTSTLRAAAHGFLVGIDGPGEWPAMIAKRADLNLDPSFIEEDGRGSSVYGSAVRYRTPDGDTLRLTHGGAFVVQVRADFDAWIGEADDNALDNLMHDNPAHQSSDFEEWRDNSASDHIDTMGTYPMLQAVLDLEAYREGEEREDLPGATMESIATFVLYDIYRRIWDSLTESLRAALVKATGSADEDEAAL